MIDKAAVLKCCGAVSWTFNLEYILFSPSLPENNKYLIFFSIIFTTVEEEGKETTKYKSCQITCHSFCSFL